MAGSFDITDVLNPWLEHVKSNLYKLGTGSARRGTTEYQNAQAEKQLRKELLDLGIERIRAQAQGLQDPTGMQAWSKVFPQLRAQSAAESALRTAELDRTTDIASRGFANKANAAAAAQSSILQTQGNNELAQIGADYQGKLGLLREGLTGQQQALGLVTNAQREMYDSGLGARSQYANRLADLSERDMAFKQDMYRQAMQQQLAANSGVRGFLSNILAPLAVAGAGVYSLLRG